MLAEGDSDDSGMFEMTDMGDELANFKNSEISGFMKLNILLNRLTSEPLRVYLRQMGHAEEPAQLTPSSDRDTMIRHLFNSNLVFQHEIMHSELLRLCNYCEVDESVSLKPTEWKTLANIFAHLSLSSIMQRQRDTKSEMPKI